MKKLLKEIEEERDELAGRCQISERKSEEFNMKLFEMEREVRNMM